MFPSALVTVLAPHWTGRFRRHKQDHQRPVPQQEDRQPGGVTQDGLLQNQTPDEPQSFVQDTNVHSRREAMEKPATISPGHSSAAWLPKSRCSSQTPSLPARALRSGLASVTANHGNQEIASLVSGPVTTEPAQSVKMKSSSLDLQFHRKISLANRGQQQTGPIGERSFPLSSKITASGFLLYLRRVSARWGNGEAPLSTSTSSAVEKTKPSKEELMQADHQQSHRIGSNGLEFLKTRSLSHGTSMHVWGEDRNSGLNRNDGASANKPNFNSNHTNNNTHSRSGSSADYSFANKATPQDSHYDKPDRGQNANDKNTFVTHSFMNISRIHTIQCTPEPPISVQPLSLSGTHTLGKESHNRTCQVSNVAWVSRPTDQTSPCLDDSRMRRPTEHRHPVPHSGDIDLGINSPTDKTFCTSPGMAISRIHIPINRPNASVYLGNARISSDKDQNSPLSPFNLRHSLYPLNIDGARVHSISDQTGEMSPLDVGDSSIVQESQKCEDTNPASPMNIDDSEIHSPVTNTCSLPGTPSNMVYISVSPRSPTSPVNLANNLNISKIQSLTPLTSSAIPTESSHHMNSSGTKRPTTPRTRVFQTRPIRSINAPTTYSSLRKASSSSQTSSGQSSPNTDLRVSPTSHDPGMKHIVWKQHFIKSPGVLSLVSEGKQLKSGFSEWLKSTNESNPNSQDRKTTDTQESSSAYKCSSSKHVSLNKTPKNVAGTVANDLAMPTTPIPFSLKSDPTTKSDSEKLTNETFGSRQDQSSGPTRQRGSNCSSHSPVAVKPHICQSNKDGRNITLSSRWLKEKDVSRNGDSLALRTTHGQLQAGRLSEGSPEPDHSHYRTSVKYKDRNGNFTQQRSRLASVHPPHRNSSPDSYVPVAGSRRSALSPTASTFTFDFDPEDAENESVFYSPSSPNKPSEWRRTNSLCDHEESKENRFNWPQRDPSCHNDSRQSISRSCFGLKSGRSFSVSNIYTGRPSGTARMARVPSVDSLDGVGRARSTRGRLWRAVSCNLDQGCVQQTRWNVQDEDVWPSPPTSPVRSPPRMSHSASSTVQESPRGRLPSKSYRSSLSTFEELDSDTTTDDEYYFSCDRGEKETEV